jgi:hypothetical protein
MSQILVLPNGIPQVHSEQPPLHSVQPPLKKAKVRRNRWSKEECEILVERLLAAGPITTASQKWADMVSYLPSAGEGGMALMRKTEGFMGAMSACAEADRQVVLDQYKNELKRQKAVARAVQEQALSGVRGASRVVVFHG